MQRAVIVIAIVILVVIAFPFVVGIFSFRIDSFYHLKGEPETTHGPLVVSFRAIKCYDSGQKFSIPGALSPNEKANGFQVAWRLNVDSKPLLKVENIKVEEVYNDNKIKPWDVPFDYWYGEFNTSRNVYLAFISTGGYPEEIPLGVYHIRLSYTANGTAYRDDVTLNYEVERKFGFHAPFYSKYF